MISFSEHYKTLYKESFDEIVDQLENTITVPFNKFGHKSKYGWVQTNDEFIKDGSKLYYTHDIRPDIEDMNNNCHEVGKVVTVDKKNNKLIISIDINKIKKLHDSIMVHLG